MDLTSIKKLATGRRAPLMMAAVSVLAIAAIACGSTTDRTPEPTSNVGSQPSGTNVGLNSGVPASVPEGIGSFPVSSDSRGISASMIAPVPTYNGQTSQVGIWVTGTGSKDVASDVAKVFIGVESREDTVTEARQKAAEAMTAVLDAIREIGVDDDDIVTRSFNIHPQTVWVEVNDEFGRHSEPRITGYVVTNNVEVTVRDLDNLDEVIDTAADRGGDLIRVNSVSFTVANPAQHGAETRQLAAADARAKAQLYADAMGVNLGPLVFLTEMGSSAPLEQSRSFAADAAVAEGAFAPTPIQSGDVSLSTTIQAAFAIVP